MYESPAQLYDYLPDHSLNHPIHLPPSYHLIRITNTKYKKPSPPVPNFKSKLHLTFVCKHAEINKHINELRTKESIHTILEVKTILLMDLDIELRLYRKMHYIP